MRIYQGDALLWPVLCVLLGSCLELHKLHSQLYLCRTVKQLLDTVEQARSGDLAESQPAQSQPSLAAPMQPSSSLDVPRKQSSIEASSSVQPMRASEGSLGSISMSNGSGGVPSWIGMPSAAAASKAGGNTLSSSSKPPAGTKPPIVNNVLYLSWPLLWLMALSSRVTPVRCCYIGV